MAAKPGKPSSQCLCCIECQDTTKDFQKIMDLKNIGLVIYRHIVKIQDKKKGTNVTTVDTKEIFIIENTKDQEITSAQCLEEIEQNRISCPRCRKIVEHAQRLLHTIPNIDKNVLRGICDHCLIEQKSCNECEQIIPKFLLKSKELPEDTKTFIKQWLSKVKRVFKSVEVDDNIKDFELVKTRAGSDLYIDRLLIKSPEKSRKPDVKHFLPSQTLSTHKTVVKGQVDDRTVSLEERLAVDPADRVQCQHLKEKRLRIIESIPPVPSHSKEHFFEGSIEHIQPTTRPKSRYNNIELDDMDLLYGATYTKRQERDSLKKYHSDQSLATITEVTTEIYAKLNKDFLYFFPKTKIYAQPKRYASSSELIKQTRDILQEKAEAEHKERKGKERSLSPAKIGEVHTGYDEGYKMYDNIGKNKIKGKTTDLEIDKGETVHKAKDERHAKGDIFKGNESKEAKIESQKDVKEDRKLKEKPEKEYEAKMRQGKEQKEKTDKEKPRKQYEEKMPQGKEQKGKTDKDKLKKEYEEKMPQGKEQKGKTDKEKQKKDYDGKIQQGKEQKEKTDKEKPKKEYEEKMPQGKEQKGKTDKEKQKNEYEGKIQQGKEQKEKTDKEKPKKEYEEKMPQGKERKGKTDKEKQKKEYEGKMQQGKEQKEKTDKEKPKKENEGKMQEGKEQKGKTDKEKQKKEYEGKIQQGKELKEKPKKEYEEKMQQDKQQKEKTDKEKPKKEYEGKMQEGKEQKGKTDKEKQKKEYEEKMPQGKERKEKIYKEKPKKEYEGKIQQGKEQKEKTDKEKPKKEYEGTLQEGKEQKEKEKDQREKIGKENVDRRLNQEPKQKDDTAKSPSRQKEVEKTAKKDKKGEENQIPPDKIQKENKESSEKSTDIASKEKKQKGEKGEKEKTRKRKELDQETEKIQRNARDQKELTSGNKQDTLLNQQNKKGEGKSDLDKALELEKKLHRDKKQKDLKERNERTIKEEKDTREKKKKEKEERDPSSAISKNIKKGTPLPDYDMAPQSKYFKQKLAEKPPKPEPKPEPEMPMNKIQARRASPDDLILRLVRLKEAKAQQRKQIKDLDLETLDTLRREHKPHKCQNIKCPLCEESDLEFDLDSILYKKEVPEFEEIIIGPKIIKYTLPLFEKIAEVEEPLVTPLLFQSQFIQEDKIDPFSIMQPPVSPVLPPTENVPKADGHGKIPQNKETQSKKTAKQTKSADNIESTKGIIRYSLSDRSFIEKGWTMLPTEKIVRKMNVYRMKPSHPEFDWFEHNKKKGHMTYDTGEILAEFDDNGRGRWYYRNGRLALDYYDAEELNANQRFVVWSNGEPDERGRSRPYTILATFDYLGNGVVFDHSGKIRLKYNQTEGIVLDRKIGPVSHWKWHTLNDPPVLQQVMIDTQMAHKDETILKLGGPGDEKPHPDNEEMLTIEFDNFIKEKSKKLNQSFKPFQIKMKALKINENFSLRVMDQASVYLIYRDGTTNLKLNIGMILDHKEIVDTDTAELGEVANNVERLPARSESIAGLQKNVAFAQRFERMQTAQERRLRPARVEESADKLTAAASRPLRPPLRSLPSDSSTSVTRTGYSCSRKPTKSNTYYENRLF